MPHDQQEGSPNIKNFGRHLTSHFQMLGDSEVMRPPGGYRGRMTLKSEAKAPKQYSAEC